jgi:hypothetical protein
VTFAPLQWRSCRSTWRDAGSADPGRSRPGSACGERRHSVGAPAHHTTGSGPSPGEWPGTRWPGCPAGVARFSARAGSGTGHAAGTVADPAARFRHQQEAQPPTIAEALTCRESAQVPGLPQGTVPFHVHQALRETWKLPSGGAAAPGPRTDCCCSWPPAATPSRPCARSARCLVEGVDGAR